MHRSPGVVSFLWTFCLWTFCLWTIGMAGGCSNRGESHSDLDTSRPRLVMTAPLETVNQRLFATTGVIRARHEIPLAFQVPGRIAKRLVDSGVRVEKGQLLLQLDNKDFTQQLTASEAQLRGAEAEAKDARRELERQREMIKTQATSQMALDKTATAVEATEQRVAAIQSQLELARNSLEYTSLKAPSDGLLIEVTGEPGQVVAAGHEVAELAVAGELEVEVSLPQSLIDSVPKFGVCNINGGDQQYPIELREVSGAADPLSRTWRARYRIVDSSAPLLFGAIVRVRMELAQLDPSVKQVPVSAIDERGVAPRIWLIDGGKAVPHDVEVLEIGGEYCSIRTQLPPNTTVISMGTHLLLQDMPVEALSQ